MSTFREKLATLPQSRFFNAIPVASAVLTVVLLITFAVLEGATIAFWYAFGVSSIVFSVSGYAAFSLLIHSAKSLRVGYPGLSIVGIISKRHSDNTRLALNIVLVGMVVALLISMFLPAGLLFVSLLALLAVALVVRLAAFTYRLRRGLYGTTEREAREIIRFILAEADHIDFTDRGKPKKILSEQDLAELSQRIAIPQPVAG
jgi:hypothetical protein